MFLSVLIFLKIFGALEKEFVYHVNINIINVKPAGYAPETVNPK